MRSGWTLLFILLACGWRLAIAADDPPPPPSLLSTPAGDPAAVHHAPSKFLPIQRKIFAGQATFAEVREALTDEDIGALTNAVHGLYSLRWHRGVNNLLHDLWAGKQDNAPELNWRQFAKPPVRLALAGTMLRIEPFKNDEYVDYLREHRYDEHEFHRAQVVVGLGFKAATQDVDYIFEMADAPNPFVAQSAITALALMNIPPARDALIRLLKKWEGDPRGKLIRDVLRTAYQWPPQAPALVVPPAAGDKGK